MEKIAIVTGASRGIGRDIAKTMAKSGMKIIAIYNKSEKEMLELKDELKNINIDIDIYKVDLTKRDEILEMISDVITKYKKIDILINNAGISSYKLFSDVTDIEWNNILNTNLYSVFALTQEVLKYMINEKEGCIINISSIWGQIGAAMESIYSVSKAGIDALTKSLAKELGPSNIRVNAISPGIINTDMNKNLNEKEKDDIISEIPLQKIGKVQDISKCIKWLIEDEYMTGQIISINGGWSI